MGPESPVCLFLLGRDYHLGDLLWLTAVIAEYRRQRSPARLLVGLPDRAISRILEHNPLIDGLRYGSPDALLGELRAEHPCLLVHDLRPLALARTMLRQWRRRAPWLYYRDLWLEPRGQWLATLLGLGELSGFRPTLELTPDDRTEPPGLAKPYVLLAPHTGQYSLRLAERFWRGIKGWDQDNWRTLALCLRRAGIQPVTLAAAGQPAIEGTLPIVGLPIRQAAAVIEGAVALVTGESGLWFVAAALNVPFLIVPWWLPRSIDWVRPMQVRHRLLRRDEATVGTVLRYLHEIRAA